MTAVEHLHPYFATLLAAASERARTLFAEEVTLEHLLVVTIEDEDTAANAVICHAFADPATVAMEALALAPGLMVVGSAGALPFSPLAARALHAVRERAFTAGWSAIDCGQLLCAAITVLPEEAQAALSAAGLRAGELEGSSGDSPVPNSGSLFRFYDSPAKRALSTASKLARAQRESSISPARIAIACIECDTTLEQRCGLTPSRARIVLSPYSKDESSPPEAKPALDPALRRFLEALPAGANSLQLLRACHGPETEEIAALLIRHKLLEPLLLRASGTFEDPSPE